MILLSTNEQRLEYIKNLLTKSIDIDTISEQDQNFYSINCKHIFITKPGIYSITITCINHEPFYFENHLKKNDLLGVLLKQINNKLIYAILGDTVFHFEHTSEYIADNIDFQLITLDDI